MTKPDIEHGDYELDGVRYVCRCKEGYVCQRCKKTEVLNDHK